MVRLHPKTIQTAFIYSIGWVVFWLILVTIDFTLTANNLILLFMVAFVYNIILNQIVPGRFT